jgi:nucleotide-binding universal stress UspA family protein
MTPKVIVSYDDTPNDQDAVVLGRRLREAGAGVALAYVRHSRSTDSDEEMREEREAHALLEHGASLLGDADAERHVVLNASTADGLWALAEQEGADIVVFGSDYHTAAGSISLLPSAKRLLDGGPAAVAIAPAGLRDREQSIVTIGVIPSSDDTSADETARALAARWGAIVVTEDMGPASLLVIGSRPEARPGQVLLTAAAEYSIDTANCPVLAVPRGNALAFAELATLGA